LNISDTGDLSRCRDGPDRLREEKTETRTGAGKAGMEPTGDIQIVACSAVETATEIDAGKVTVREAEDTLNHKRSARNTAFICKRPTSNALR
jgi:hypothetical protein